jgi:small-conductance mechanosensitive channel
MKLNDALLLSISAKDLALLTGTSERQIRKLRADPKKPRPEIDLDDAKLADLVRRNEEIDSTIKARDTWYMAEQHLLKVLQTAVNHFDKIKKLPEATLALTEVKAQIEHESAIYTEAIQGALKLRTEATANANRLGIKAIWNTNEEALTKLLGRYRVHQQAQEKPSEEMKKRIKGRLASDAA